jgi:hypothetical protein
MRSKRSEREAMLARLREQTNGHQPEDFIDTSETALPGEAVFDLKREVVLTTDEPQEIHIGDLPPVGTPERMQTVRDIRLGKVRYNRPLSDEQEVELLDAYTKTDEPLASISQRFGVRPTYPYNVLDRAGVTWRRDHAQTFDEWQAEQARPKAEPEPEVIVTPQLPEVVINQRVLPPEIEAMRAIRPAQPKPEPPVEFDGPTWEVEYTGRMLVKAASIDQALERARADGHITNIVSVSMRAR